MNNVSNATLTNDICNFVFGSKRSTYLRLTNRLVAAAIFVAAILAPGSAQAQSFLEKSYLADASAAMPSPVAPAVVPSRLFATPTVTAPKSNSRARTLWVLSGVALTAASMADLGTSLGHNEANPALRNSSGQFSAARGVSIKLGVSGVTLLVQSLLMRHRHDMYGTSAAINLVGAGIMGGVAYHNANTPR